MQRRMRRRTEDGEERDRGAAPAVAPVAAEVLRLQRSAGNSAVAQLLARRTSVAAPVKDRKPIDALKQQQNVTPEDRVRDYAKIAGTSAVKMDPAVVNASGLKKDGLNLVQLKQDDDVPAQTAFIDSKGNAHGGRPPEDAVGVAILVNTTADRFEDEDYMVGAIRHEMVHARLMRLTLQQLADWKQDPRGMTFSQYVDKMLGGTDGALVRDRSFGGHMDETVAYAEGFLSAFFYTPPEAPGPKDHAWIEHFKGFGKELQKARANSGGVGRDRSKVDPHNLAIRESATAVITEAEKLAREYCDGFPAQRKNLAAWMAYFKQAGGHYEPALKLVYSAATSGKVLP
jgi:hypothetical protein